MWHWERYRAAYLATLFSHYVCPTAFISLLCITAGRMLPKCEVSMARIDQIDQTPSIISFVHVHNPIFSSVSTSSAACMTEQFSCNTLTCF